MGRRRMECLASVAAPKGAQRASPQTRGSAVDAPQGHRAPRRGRARKGAYPQRPLCCNAGTPRGPDDFVGRAVGSRPWREVSRVDVGVIRCRAPVRGGARWPACRMAGGTVFFVTRRGRRMRRQGNTRRRADCRNSLRDPDDLRWQGERIAHHNLAHSTTRPWPLVRLRGRGRRPFRADLFRLPDDLTKDSADEFGERV